MPAPYSSISIPKRLLMGPGPSEVDPRVYHAMTNPVVGYLDGVLLKVMDEIHAMLRTVFSTQNAATFPLPGTGSAGMEASLINFIEPGDDVAVVVGGTFAARMCEMVERCGGRLLRIDHRPGTIADPDQVRQAVRGKKLKVLAVVHSETSTGICQPLEPLKKIAQETGALLVVDTVSSLGGLPLKVDEWGLDVCYSGSQKCLACPPGLAPLTIAESAREVLRRRQKPVQSWYLDLSMVEKYWSQERRYHHTPPVSMLYALHEALRVLLEEDLEAVWARHQQCHRAFVNGVEAMGLKMFVEDPAARAWTVNTVRCPEGIEEAKVRASLTQSFGIEIATGIGDLRGKIWRVGLMGRTAKPELVLLLLNALESSLNDNGFACPRGAGVAAAEKELQVSVK
jgi:alanine-glyoxylate transaminase/serine-glyoxylate transaminase/serine-pyruvate transaminase